MKTLNQYQMLNSLIKKYNDSTGSDLNLPKKSVQLIQEAVEDRPNNNEVDDILHIALYSFKNKIYAIVDGYLDILLDELVSENNTELYSELYNQLSAIYE